MAARSALAALNKNVIMVLVANNEEAFIHSFMLKFESERSSRHINKQRSWKIIIIIAWCGIKIIAIISEYQFTTMKISIKH